MLYAYGFLAGTGVDRETMRRTLQKVMDTWRWPDTWGWDLALNALFLESPKNTCLPSGHIWQRPNLPVYLPSNGALLLAIAMMASAWNGFPRDKWNVRAEGLQPIS